MDLVIESAKDLKDVNLFSKMDVYAVIKIDGDHNLKSSKHKTPTDKDCGTNPKWNFPVQFTVDDAAAQQNRLTLVVKIKSDRTLSDKEIGEVKVPIKELWDGFGDAKETKHASYSVTTPSGKVKGTLDFSYKFGEKFAREQHKYKQIEPAPAYPAGYAAGSSVPAAYPPPGAYPPSAGAYPPPAGAYPPPAGAYPPPAGAYPPPQPAAYPPVAAGYGGYPPGGYPQNPQYPPPGGYPPQAGYGYGGYGAPVQQPQKSMMGGAGGMALGVGAGLLGGLVVGEMISDVSEAATYDAGYDGGFDF